MKEQGNKAFWPEFPTITGFFLFLVRPAPVNLRGEIEQGPFETTIEGIYLNREKTCPPVVTSL